jgi:hypothetical protein
MQKLAQRVNITANRDVFKPPVASFWRTEPAWTGDLHRLRQASVLLNLIIEEEAKAEVTYNRVEISIEKNVPRLQVPMHNAILMGMGDALAYSRESPKGFDDVAFRCVLHRAVLAQWRHEIRDAPVIVAVINDLQDVRIIERPKRLNRSCLSGLRACAGSIVLRTYSAFSLSPARVTFRASPCPLRGNGGPALFHDLIFPSSNCSVSSTDES